MFKIQTLITNPKSTNKNNTTLIFLSGFLGDASEWLEISNDLNNYFIKKNIYFDFLGCSIQSVNPEDDLNEINIKLTKQLNGYHIDEYILIGYSLGGRIVFHHIINQKNKTSTESNSKLLFAIIESSHFGLCNENSRIERLQNDKNWANRFANEKLTEVLNDWYQQPVFAYLSENQRKKLIALRSKNEYWRNGKKLSNIIIATSLAKQDYLINELAKTNVPVLYLTGEFDIKYNKLAKNCDLFKNENWQHKIIRNSGHNIHQHQKNEYIRELKQFISNIIF